MVRLRRDILATVYGVLLVALLIVNWVGVRERYAVSRLPCSDVDGIAIGDVDVRVAGDELVSWTANDIYVIYNATGVPGAETVYTRLDSPSNPLTGLAVADFDPERKGEEIIMVTANGTVLLLSRDSDSWESVHVADLPWPSPVWTTRAIVGARFDPSLAAAGLAIVGEHFDWPTQNLTGRVLMANRASNVTWQVNMVYVAVEPLLCAAAGELNGLQGLELLTAGEEGSIKTLTLTNGSWSATNFFTWSGVISSVTVGNLVPPILGYRFDIVHEVALVLNGQPFVFSYNGAFWQPRQILSTNTTGIALQTLAACDVDPFNPGDELLGLGSNTRTGDSVVVVLGRYGSLWTNRVLLALPEGYVTVVQFASFDFSRAGIEVVVAGRELITIYAIPSSADRTVRASSAVLLPAVVLLPSTALLFLLADHVGRLADERRLKYGLLMAARGFAQCPICKRFLPRADLEAHRRVHRRRRPILAY